MIRLRPIQKFISLFVPVRVLRTSSSLNPVLELYRYQNRWQLATEDAFYSDGAQYTPLRKAFKALGKGVFAWESVLVLGAGLGSTVTILDRHYKRKPECTLVDLDEEILTLAGEILAAEGHAGHVELIHEDAARYVGLEDRQFDCVIVDLFRGRSIPDFALQEVFLRQCRALVAKDGNLIMNYIVNEATEWQMLQHRFQNVFSGYRVLAHGINRILIYTNTAAG